MHLFKTVFSKNQVEVVIILQVIVVCNNFDSCNPFKCFVCAAVTGKKSAVRDTLNKSGTSRFNNSGRFLVYQF